MALFFDNLFDHILEMVIKKKVWGKIYTFRFAIFQGESRLFVLRL